MFSPTIHEDLARLRQAEIAREAERRCRLVAERRASSRPRGASALLALVRRRSTPHGTGRRPEVLAG